MRLFCITFANVFGSLFKLIDNVQNLDQDKIATTIYFDKDIQKFILRENRIDQLSKGLDSEGTIIGTYSPITDITSDGKVFTFEDTSVEKIAGQPYNFIDTSKFMKSFKIIIYDDGFSIIADTQKDNEDLADKYGKKILGLTSENIAKLVDNMRPLFIKKTRNLLTK